MNLNTKIEWCDATTNIIKGWCPNNCEYCYSHRMYNRFGWDKTLRFDEDELIQIKRLKEPRKVFVGSMIEMYHSQIPTEWVERIIEHTKRYDQNTFITLTKCPNNLSCFMFPAW